MSRSTSSLRVCLVLAALMLLLTGCTPPRGPADPFSGGRSPAREGVRQYTVRLEVGCDYCYVSVGIGPERQSIEARQLWSQRVSLHPLQPTAIRLSATPTDEGRAIRWVRISVDGEVVAEEGCGECDRTAEVITRDRSTVSVETVIPRRN